VIGDDEVSAALGAIRVAPARLVLEGLRPPPPVATLRGVWGAALHRVDLVAYESVFTGTGPAHERLPRYVLREGEPVDGWATLEWVQLPGAEPHGPALARAWDVASGMGVGRDRTPFVVRAATGIGPDDARTSGRAPGWWSLDRAAWPLVGAPSETPCTLTFSTPIRLIRDAQLLDRVQFPDVIVAACRRMRALAGPTHADAWRAIERSLLDDLRDVRPCVWEGHRARMRRWSARQEQETDLHGLVGALTLLRGPGASWPVIAAARWVHLGKGTVFGLGRFDVLPAA